MLNVVSTENLRRSTLALEVTVLRNPNLEHNAHRSSETTSRYPRRAIDVFTAQLVTYGDASFAQHGRFEEGQWLPSVPAEMWPFCSVLSSTLSEES